MQEPACLPLPAFPSAPLPEQGLTGRSWRQPLVLSVREHSETGALVTTAEPLGLPCPRTYQLASSWQNFLGKRSPFS